jgi:hypothetical protein
MPDIHEVLRWANRTAVAQEITRRGYRVSGETLNRWYRQRSEVPAVVERIVFEMFGHNETAPAWGAELESRIVDELHRNRQLIEALALPADLVEAAWRVIGRLEALPPQGVEAPDDPADTEGPAAESPQGRGSESPPVPNAGRE